MCTSSAGHQSTNNRLLRAVLCSGGWWSIPKAAEAGAGKTFFGHPKQGGDWNAAWGTMRQTKETMLIY